MRVHANRDSALVLAAQASKAVPKITTIPELKGIHMEADARLAMLTMTATNQEVSIRASMPAAVEESGSAVIPADLLPDILKRLPGDQVSFSTVGPGIIHIGSGYAEYRLNILDAAKYPLPEVPFLEDTIPVSGICSLARQTLFAAAAGDQQNILKTVRLKVGPYGLKATSSNGFCIAEAAGDKNCVAASETCILVPARSLSILAAISLDSDVYQMGLTREGLAFWNGTTMFCTHLIDGSYPDTDGLLDRIQGAYSASIEAAELYAAVDAVTSLASADKDSSGRGEIMFGEHEMVVSAETSDGRASVPVKALILSPSPYPFYYDFKQLMRYLKQLRGRITLEFDQNGLLAIRPGETRYPTIKAACEGRQIPAYEAAGEFISQVADNLDSLMEQAGGQKNALETLEHLEEKRDQSMERLQKLIEQMEQSGATPALETQLIKAANTAQSQSNQVEAVGRIVQENLQKHGGELTLLVKQASEAAAQTAIDVQLTLMSWGTGPDNSDPKSIAADTELVHRVQQNDTLMKVARYLGRLKELMEGKRKNGYAYGRGEKYTLELGADLSRALASEFVLLALPETTPLFLRKLQKKGLKQYQRREAIRKGSGDIICMLDESDSAEEAAPWCKAVALALLDIAMRDQRRFAMIHFSGKGHFKTDLFIPRQYDQEDVLRAAELFLSGGTNYETPLQEALRLMEESGFENADMVFITDGACELPSKFRERLSQEQAKRGFHITGVLLDQDSGAFEFSLAAFCDEIIRTSELTREQIAERLVSSRIA